MTTNISEPTILDLISTPEEAEVVMAAVQGDDKAVEDAARESMALDDVANAVQEDEGEVDDRTMELVNEALRGAETTDDLEAIGEVLTDDEEDEMQDVIDEYNDVLPSGHVVPMALTPDDGILDFIDEEEEASRGPVTQDELRALVIELKDLVSVLKGLGL